MDTFDSDSQRKILNRLRRARGQLDAVISKVENQGSCKEVVTQLAAVTSALDRAGFTIISTAMKDCLTEEPGEETAIQSAVEGGVGSAGEPENSEKLSIEELEKLFMMLS